ncbi:MAG: ABC transporter substrate-binding protein, partial [Anaerolineales bacterium]
MKKTLWIFWSMLLVLAFVLSACGPKVTPTQPATQPAATKAPATEAPTQPPATQAAQKVTIAFWEQEGEDVDVFLDQLIAEFEAANPNIKVERTHYDNEALRDQFQTAALAEAAPEVVRVPN